MRLHLLQLKKKLGNLKERSPDKLWSYWGDAVYVVVSQKALTSQFMSSNHKREERVTQYTGTCSINVPACPWKNHTDGNKTKKEKPETKGKRSSTTY